MQAQYTFDSPFNWPASTSMTVRLIVSYSIDIEVERGDICPIIRPELYSVEMGGNVIAEDEPVKHLVGPMAAFIKAQDMTLEALGLTEGDLRDELNNNAAWDATYASLQPGRV